MSEEPFISTAERAVAALRDAGEPLTADQLLERLPPYVRKANANPRRWLQQAVLSRPEVGRVGRGVYVYLPRHITGSTLRVPITGLEPQDRHLRLGHEVAYSLWFRSVNWRWIKRGVTATCELPDGQESTISYEDVDDVGPLVTAGDELLDWLGHEHVVAGDSLLLKVRDAETQACRLTLERLAQRDGPRMAERDRQLADAAVRALREARGQRLAFDLTSWLLSGDFYHHECPPDPLLMVLLLVDDRFHMDLGGEIGLGTKWDRLANADAEFLEAVEEIAREMAEERRSRGALQEPFHALGRWIDAVGLLPATAAQTGGTSETGATVWSSAIYRLRVALQYTPTIWRTIEMRGDQTFGQLDQAIRKAFEHDLSDHLSEFSVRIKGRRGTEGLGEIYPGGGGEGAALQLGAADLKRGDALGYLYDFGESIRHTVKVEAVVKPAPGATYPREVARNAPRYRHCDSCAEHGEQQRATWRCIDCSNEELTEVILCDECLNEHENHYLDHILY